uniref:Uncharacterized protein n=1 Tax=viral metagenome TaxID=1070528 RepID=A0A6C0CMP2_9ZZZZ
MFILLLFFCVLSIVAFYMYFQRPNLLDQPIPSFLSEPAGSMQTFYASRADSNKWGSASVDGPDKCLPKHCVWKNGILVCRSQ